MHGNKGRKMSKKQKQVLSKIHKEKVKDPKYLSILINRLSKTWNSPRVFSEETGEKISRANKNRIIPEHQRIINSRTQKKLMTGEENRQNKIKIHHALIIKDMILEQFPKSMTRKELDKLVAEEFSEIHNIQISSRTVQEIRLGNHYSCEQIGQLKDWLKK